MPAAMHLTVLLSLLTATAYCVSSTVTATSASYTTQSLATSSTVKTSTVTPQLQTTTQTTTDLTSASPQTTTAEQTGPSSAPLNTTVSQTSNETVTWNQTVLLTSESLNVTAGTSGNKTSSDISGNKENYNLAENPGLVAVICIFTIVFGLLLVVMTVKCVRSSRSNFERLEDVPMGKVNEASPFAHYTK
ncbi:putative LOC729966 homolog isoform X2 [Poecilia reticulata]|uniref:putative LOC729966 homolog isoform X2 n=1 Tax=Poecilia reticulata TaxID=8081 RepID=UPI0004A37CD5|nr:PREDICTED: cell wall integrity and stress response component 4-like isoform X2 [Poecilia reticulata]